MNLERCTVCKKQACFKAPFKRGAEIRWFWFCAHEVCFMIHSNSDWDVLLPKSIADQTWKECIEQYRKKQNKQ